MKAKYPCDDCEPKCTGCKGCEKWDKWFYRSWDDLSRQCKGLKRRNTDFEIQMVKAK